MSDDTDRLLRIKSLIDRDMQSVRGRIAPVQPPQPMTDSAFQQRKEQLEAQDLAIREKTNKQRQQRQMRHRQYLLAEEAQRAALKEQKQKQETTRLQKENVERQKMQRQMRSTVPAAQRAKSEHEQKSDGKVLELTELVRQGQSSQQREALSRKDARLYSPFARTEPLRPSSQQSFLQILGAGVCAFLLAPFHLLWRSVLWPYRVVRSVSKHGYRSRQQGLKHSLGYTTATMLRSCWHFATAPLHLFAHAVLDPLGLFTRQPHNYPRLSPLVYVRIFAQQIQRNFLILLRGVGLLAQMLGRFVAAPFLLFASIVLLPWRSLRYGAARNVLGLVASSCAGFWRKARIRSIGFVHALQPRISAVFRAQREKSHRAAGATGFLLGSIVRKGFAYTRRDLPRLWRAQRERSERSFAALLRRTGQARKPFFERKMADARTVTAPRTIPASLNKDDGHGRGDKASEQEEKPLSAATEKTRLFASNENSLLEDFFANEQDAEQNAEGDKVEDKDTVHREMDNLRSTMERGLRSEDTSLSKGEGSKRGAASDEEKVFQEVEELDEKARAKLLQRLARKVETEKLR